MNFSVLDSKQVLVVEDNTINQMLVKHTLSKSGASIDIASNGRIALDFMKEKAYDLILMDIHMPELDGYQTTHIIRNEFTLSVPIIAMTALALKGEDEKCIAAGMNGYVAKPFTIEGLYKEVERVMQKPVTFSNKEHIVSDGEVFINMGTLDEFASSDKSYIKTMINLFLENMPVTLKKMEDSLKAKDWDLLFRTAHYAKSSLSVVRIRQLHDLAQEIEYSAKVQQGLELLPAKMAEMKSLYAKAEILLQKELKQLVDTPQSVINFGQATK